MSKILTNILGNVLLQRDTWAYVGPTNGMIPVFSSYRDALSDVGYRRQDHLIVPVAIIPLAGWGGQVPNDAEIILNDGNWG